jgi:hypothetical protein
MTIDTLTYKALILDEAFNIKGSRGSRNASKWTRRQHTSTEIERYQRRRLVPPPRGYKKSISSWLNRFDMPVVEVTDAQIPSVDSSALSPRTLIPAA